MAVAHSASSESHTGATGSANQASFSWTHTQTGTPRGVVVFVHVTNSAADTVTGVNYGAVALTRIPGGAAIDAAGEPIRTDLFFSGVSLPTGNQTVTVTRTNNANIMYATVSTVTAATNTNITGIVLLQGDGTLVQQSVNDGSPGTNSLRYAGSTSGLNAPPTAGANSTLLQSIDLGNQTCALVRETTAGQGSRLVGFTGATDDRAAIHVAVRELFNRTLTQTVASFIFTGNQANLNRGRQLTANTGLFTLTGNQATLLHNYKLNVNTGSFNLTGNNVDLAKTSQKSLDVEFGQFIFTGNDASTRHNVVNVNERGAFTFTGQDVTLKRTFTLSTDLSLFNLTGGLPTFLKSFNFIVESGNFTFTGNSVSLADSDTLPPVVGSFILTGNSINILRDYAISTDIGSFSLDGKNADFLYSLVLNVTPGSFIETGLPAVFIRSRALIAGTGSFVLTGGSITVPIASDFLVNTGEFSVTGSPVALNYERRRRVVFVF